MFLATSIKHHHKKVTTFPGFCQFLPPFHQEFQFLTSPLIILMKGRPTSLSWTPSATQAMQILKDAFTSAPDPSRSRQAILCRSQFFNNCRRSGAFTGAGETITSPSMFLLFQKAHSGRTKLCYWKLWAPCIKLALEEWKHWLKVAGHPFLVLTDHRNLEYLCEAKRLNPR